MTSPGGPYPRPRHRHDADFEPLADGNLDPLAIRKNESVMCDLVAYRIAFVQAAFSQEKDELLLAFEFAREIHAD